MTKEQQKEIEQHIYEIIKLIGDDPTREGVVETPKRVAKAFKEWFRGYQEPEFDITSFTSTYRGIIARKGIPFVSHCEHHMCFYKGTIDFAYIPNGKIVGLSKIIRLLQHYSSRLSVQEELTTYLADKFQEHVSPDGLIMVIKANHFCESTRGVKVPDVPTITSEVRGIFKDDPDAKQEFLELIK